MVAPRRFFVSTSPRPGDVVLLGDAERRHARVLRLAEGDAVELFDGLGGAWEARVGTVSRGRLEVVVGPKGPAGIVRESPLTLTLAQGLARGARMDEVIRHGTELGIGRFVLVRFRRSTRRDGNPERWRSIARDAARQCGRNVVPEVGEVVDLGTFLEGERSGWSCLLLPPGEGVLTLSMALPEPLHAATLVVGPEGGLDDDEIAAARRAGFHGISLGPRVLRTETAGLAAVAAIQALRGDLG